MLFHQFFNNKLYSTCLRKRVSINVFQNMRLFQAPKIFHLPRLKLTMSLPPKINKNLLNVVRVNSQFRSLYSWSKPELFVKKGRELFLYYYFLKNNNKSLSHIFTKFKKLKTPAIVSFFTKTIGYVLDIFFKTSLGPGSSSQVTVNLNKMHGNWHQVSPNTVLQVIWRSNSIAKKKRGYIWQNYTTISLSKSHINLTYNGISGIVDYRTNSLFITCVKQPSTENLNLLNLNVTSVYNWKIII